jgi:hypothetical protein
MVSKLMGMSLTNLTFTRNDPVWLSNFKQRTSICFKIALEHRVVMERSQFWTQQPTDPLIRILLLSFSQIKVMQELSSSSLEVTNLKRVSQLRQQWYQWKIGADPLTISSCLAYHLQTLLTLSKVSQIWLRAMSLISQLSKSFSKRPWIRIVQKIGALSGKRLRL